MLSDTLDEGRTGVPLRFTVPDEFQEVPLDEPAQDRVRRSFRQLREGIDGITDEQALFLVYTQELSLEKLGREGCVYLGRCVARTEDDVPRLTSAQYTILVKKADLDADEPLDAVAGGLRRPGEPREVIFNEYPAGKGVVVGEELAVTVPFGPLGQNRSATHRVRQAQVLLPFPDRRRLAMIGVSSQSLEEWSTYVRILDGIARSVSFTEPPATSIAAALGP